MNRICVCLVSTGGYSGGWIGLFSTCWVAMGRGGNQSGGDGNCDRLNRMCVCLVSTGGYSGGVDRSFLFDLLGCDGKGGQSKVRRQ